MANPAVVVDFVANTKDLQKGFSQASGKASGFGSKLKGLAFGAAAAGAAALGSALRTGVAEWAEAQKVGAQTNSVLKSTGGIANVTAGQVESLAGALMKKSGVDDEAIQSGENLLLTFTNIRNEAGKNNDIFNQATKTALDMSVALGTDMTQASMQLGKALNNPTKGISALSRVGVTFTEQQKKQIKALQDSGKTAEAQKIILAELQKEFGGSAEAAGKTLPGQLNVLKQTFSNLAGEVVGKMIPPLTSFLKLLLQHKTMVIALVAVFATLTAGVLAVTAAVAVWNAATKIAAVATKAWAAAQWLINAALSANPIGLVVIAIAALIAAFVLAYKTSDKFRAIVDAAFAAIKKAAKAVYDWIRANWPTLLAILTGPMGLATLAIARNWDTIKRTVSSAVNAVKNWVVGAWDTIKDHTTSAWNAVKSAISNVISAIKTAMNGLATWISGFASGALSTVISRVKARFEWIADGARAAVSSVKNIFNDLISWMSRIVDNVGSTAHRIADAIKRPLNAVIGAWNAMGIPRVQIRIPGLKIKGHTIFPGKTIGFGPFAFPDIRQLATGGVIDQPTLALVGEGQGREIVTPESLLREIMGEQRVQVRVFIGDRELTQIVRTEIVDTNTGLARTLLAGGR